MRHPYALVPGSRPPSLCSVPSRSGTPEPERSPPQPNRRPLTIESSLVPILSSIIPLGTRGLAARPRLAPAKKSATAGHYVKHSSRVTLLLSGQEEGAEMPAYSTGDTVEAILAIARPAGVLALEAKIEGVMQLEELGGSGTVTVKVLDKMVYSWVPSRHGPFPAKASFRYTLPKTFRDPAAEREYPLPPTHNARLEGFPGFSVTISYAIVVCLTRLREASTLWRGFHSMRVPFRYTHRTCPALPSPFPCNIRNSERNPRTLFVFQMRPWRGSSPGIKVHVYLPASQVCSAQEPIPFHVSLFADEYTLEPFAAYRPPSASFLPLASAGSGSGSSTSCESVAAALPRRVPRCPLRIQVQRATIVDARRAGLASPSPGLCGFGGGSQLGQAGVVPPEEQSHMHCTEWIGQGMVHSAGRSASAVVWSGAIIIPPSAAGLGGGFEVNGLRVADSLVLSIDPPAGCRQRYIPLAVTIPLQLTSDVFGCEAAVTVSPLG
ncbi:hypothetical protein C8Q78DRAFT_1069599 [Trametes maxima]|nr:hypothetical protein C8Q78DRAFT_1069599 [Trametes maxima]